MYTHDNTPERQEIRPENGAESIARIRKAQVEAGVMKLGDVLFRTGVLIPKQATAEAQLRPETAQADTQVVAEQAPTQATNMSQARPLQTVESGYSQQADVQTTQIDDERQSRINAALQAAEAAHQGGVPDAEAKEGSVNPQLQQGANDRRLAA